MSQWILESCAIISGIAKGIDALSHRILNAGYILTSEYPIFTGVEKYRLIERNRIITGLSQAVVIFACALKGGTMHSAAYAKKQHKPIFCPPLFSDSSGVM